MHKILKMLQVGDLRKKGNSEYVVRLVKQDPSLMKWLIEGMQHTDSGIRMRAADATEKLTRAYPQYLQPYKKILLHDVTKIEQQEVRWHLALILPRLTLTKQERQMLYEILRSYLASESRIVVTFAMQGLADIAKYDKDYTADTLVIIKKLVKDGSPAMQSRGKKLLKQFGQMIN